MMYYVKDVIIHIIIKDENVMKSVSLKLLIPWAYDFTITLWTLVIIRC